MSLSYIIVSTGILLLFPVCFYLLQVGVFSHVPNVQVSKPRCLVLWVIVSVISLLFAFMRPLGGFGALISLLFECGVMLVICMIAFHQFEDSALWQILKKLLGL